MDPRDREGSLERTLDFQEAFTIGVGTMIGAGIFIFPGIAAGRAGMAAIVSFGLGAVIATLVALSVSELATAIPRSGGTYYFVSEGLGRLPGAMVGIAIWWGLIFASAFYLFGFGTYLNEVATELGIPYEVGAKSVGITTALLLTIVNVLGTEKSGELQDVVVYVLLAILAIFLGYGALDATGIFGRSRVPQKFAPEGVFPIFTTAALVFTSYLGFAGIANMSGEIKDPSRNLPRSMIGSVLLVGVLYMLTIFVSNSAFGAERLGALGETALVEVGRVYFGPVGAVVVLVGGLLATLSSANASIMGSSRSVYAISSDHVLPDRMADVNDSFGTPHVSLLSTGLPVAGIVAFGKLELLAEVASFLHLVLYGLMCFAAWHLRETDPDWYEPTFRAPGHPYLPLAGGVASFALILFMKTWSQILGAVVMVLAAVWYYVYTTWVDEHD
jgi:amino acid transporter